jgi:hypothetical protein
MKKGKTKGDLETNQSGFITLIIFFIIALALLKYFFNWSIFEASSTPQGQETVGYTRHVIDTIWFYLRTPIAWIWNNIIWPILGFVWRAFQDLIVSSRSSTT